MIKVMAADLRKCCSKLRHGNSFYPSFSFLVLLYSFSKVRISPSKVLIACYGFCLLRHVNKPGLHVILLQWLDVFFVCTLLHCELRDYSLGQVAFAVFQALLAITQLLCHVSALLTSACNANKRL